MPAALGRGYSGPRHQTGLMRSGCAKAAVGRAENSINPQQVNLSDGDFCAPPKYPNGPTSASREKNSLGVGIPKHCSIQVLPLTPNFRAYPLWLQSPGQSAKPNDPERHRLVQMFSPQSPQDPHLPTLSRPPLNTLNTPPQDVVYGALRPQLQPGNPLGPRPWVSESPPADPQPL